MLLFLMTLSDHDGEILFGIYSRLKYRLLYTAHSYVGDRAEDIVHDVFVKLSEKFEKNMGQLCDKQDYYFVTIVKNHAIDLLRREGRVPLVELEDTVFQDLKQEPDHQVLAKDEGARLRAFLEQLRPMYREVLEYKYLLGYGNQEIAELLQVSPSVVSTRIQRALGQLKKRFEEEDVMV